MVLFKWWLLARAVGSFPGQMVQHSDAQHRIEDAVSIGQVQVVRDADFLSSAVLRRQGRKRRASIGSQRKSASINAEILSISAADIGDQRARLQPQQKFGYFGPRGVPRVAEVWSYNVIYFVDKLCFEQTSFCLVLKVDRI